MRGLTVCTSHGGLAPAAQAAAKRRLLEAKVGKDLQQKGWEPLNDPVAKYSDLAGEVWAWKELCREQINVLTEWSAFDAKDEEYARAVIVLYERALDRAGKTIMDMLRLGLDAAAFKAAKERPTREQAEVLVRVLETVFESLDLTEAQRAMAPNAVGAALREQGLL